MGNQGKIAEQGALTWVLHSQTGKWKDRVLLERNFTMNGNWMDYYGKWTKGARSLAAPVWGDSRIPFVVQYAGCQVSRGPVKPPPSPSSSSPPLPLILLPACRCAAATQKTAHGTITE